MRSVNTTGFKLKTRRVRLAFAKAAIKVMAESSQKVYDEADKFLKGPGITPGVSSKEDYRIGTMPVPRRTGDLSRSLTMTPLGHTTWLLWCDPHVASYAMYVHDGTKPGGKWRMRPRRFLGSPVDQYRPIIREKIKHKLLAAIRMEGRR